MAAGEQKGYRGVWYAIVAALGIATALSYLFSDDIYGAGSWFLSHEAGDPFLDSFLRAVPGMVTAVRAAFFGYILGRAAEYAIDRAAAGKVRRLTASRLAKSVIKYAVAIVVVFLFLMAWGVDVVTLLIGAGVLTLVISLGAESLIQDILAGLFTTFEDEYTVGDIVVIDGWRGTVQEIGIRCTKVVDYGGNVLIIGNSQIGEVENLSRQSSLIITTLSYGFEGDLHALERMYRENLHRIREAIPEIVDGPYYRGVGGYSDYYVELVFHTYCREEDYYMVQRALDREFQMLYNETEVYDPYWPYTFHGLSDDTPMYKVWKERCRERESEGSE